MTIQTIPGGLWIPYSFPATSNLPGFTLLNTLNTAATYCAFVFQVPKSGTLDMFEWRVTNNNNTPDNGLRFSFQDVTTAGNPDNTEDQYAVVTSGFASGAWLVPANVMTNTGAAGGVKRVVTRGDWLACVIRFENFVASDSISMTASQMVGAAPDPDPQLRYMLTSTNSGTAWTKAETLGLPSFALKYDDGTYGELGWPLYPATVITNRLYANNSTPDERGLLFQLPFPARISGVNVRCDIDANCDIILYDAASAILASVSLITGRRINTLTTNARINFPTPVNLLPNVNYRIAVLPTTTTSVTIYDFDVATAAIRASIDGGSTWMSTQRTNAGAWTDVTTNRPFIGLILDGFDDGTGSGSGGGEHSSVF